MNFVFIFLKWHRIIKKLTVKEGFLMKLYISADIEGSAAIMDWDEALPGGTKYPYFAEIMTKEVAAACRGAENAGWEVTVKDAHCNGRNINPENIPENVTLIRGWTGDMLEMMGGLDKDEYDAVAFTGYHSDAWSDGNTLSHTMVRKVNRFTINGIAASEFIINAYIAAYFKKPIVFLSGDEALCKIAKEMIPCIETISSKSVIGGATLAKHPEKVRKEIETGIEKALKLKDIDKTCVPELPEYFVAEVEYKEWQEANKYSNYPGAKRTDVKKVSYESHDYMDVLKFIMFCI